MHLIIVATNRLDNILMTLLSIPNGNKNENIEDVVIIMDMAMN